MTSLVLYYSRSGNTAALAEAIVRRIGADSWPIGCPTYGTGWFGYMRAGYDSLMGRMPEIDIPDRDLGGYDLVVLAGPIWTSYPATPLRALIATRKDLPPRVALALTYGGHSPPEDAVKFAADLLPQGLAGSLCVRGKSIDAAGAEIDAFAESLGA